MKLFSYLYMRMLAWSKHQFAPYILAGVAFSESSFFPIPPDVMLVSMGLANQKNLWRLALITTVSSVLGGVFGYLIGTFFIDALIPFIQSHGYYQQYQHIVSWFNHWGVWVVFLAGFSPIPYKLFTIGAGALSMPFIPFCLASFISRGLRFYLVAGLLIVCGEKIDKHLRRTIDLIGWSAVTIFVIVYLFMLYK